jgi:hypothetical protein
MIEKTLHRLAISKMRGDNFWSILGVNTDVENTLRFNNYARALLAKAMTMAATYFYGSVLQLLPSYLCLEGLIDSIRPHRKTRRLLADKDSSMVLHTTLNSPDP